MLTVATACDGEVECFGGLDENWVCDWKAYIVYGVVAVLMAAIYLILLVMKYYETTDIIFQDFGLRIIFQLMKIPDLEEFGDIEDDDNLKRNINKMRRSVNPLKKREVLN